MLIQLKPVLKFPTTELIIKCTLFEYNKGTEELANVPKNRSRTKHIELKQYHFREAVRKKILQVRYVDTQDQLTDIFKKLLTSLPLEQLRKRIMGQIEMLSYGDINTESYEVYREQSMGVFSKQ